MQISIKILMPEKINITIFEICLWKSKTEILLLKIQIRIFDWMKKISKRRFYFKIKFQGKFMIRNVFYIKVYINGGFVKKAPIFLTLTKIIV